MKKHKQVRYEEDFIDDSIEPSIIDLYNLPKKLKLSTKENLIYENIKNELLLKQIDLETIIKLPNVLEDERLGLVEKYSLMINSEDDLLTYLRYRDEINSMINYYNNSDMELRRINMEKKKKLDSIIINTSELENKILNLNFNNNLYIQGLIYQKYKKLINLQPTDPEYHKLKEWLDIAINIPFNNLNKPILKDNISEILINIKKNLDKELFGMNKVKEELLMAINQRFINPSKSDTNIALVGPPGVGKTKIITVLANILSYPWEHISMGGTNDSSFLAGHSYTYEGAKPGKIVDSLIKMKCNNGILFFDEIDKIADTSNGKEVSSQLLHITDFTQNDHFCDKYLPEIPINLSKIWFIFSLNNINDIDPILSNRLNYIYVDGYTDDEKLEICKKHLLIQAYEKYKLEKSKYEFNDSIIKKIIIYTNKKEKITNNKTGIRELKRTIDHIFNRLSLLDNITKNNNITKNLSFYPSEIKKVDNIINYFLELL